MKETRHEQWSGADSDFLIRTALPHVYRVGRAFAYAFAGYLLLYLQPHFSFSFAAFALAIFCLALVKRGSLVAEVALLLLVVAVFIPPGTLQSLATLF